jgi:hypothetical protein
MDIPNISLHIINLSRRNADRIKQLDNPYFYSYKISIFH